MVGNTIAVDPALVKLTSERQMLVKDRINNRISNHKVQVEGALRTDEIQGSGIVSRGKKAGEGRLPSGSDVGAGV